MHAVVRPVAMCVAGAVASTMLHAEPQQATVADMRIMEPYIGEFRSPTRLFDDGKTEFYHLVRYQWFDQPKTIVKFTIAMAIPSQGRVITTAEGFYGFDSIKRQLYVFGAFTRGTSGRGTICEFNLATAARTVCARSMSADGTITDVRDAFEVNDGNSWRNATRIRTGEADDWKLVHESTYTRVND